MIRDETIETIWKRTHLTAEAFRQGVKALGFELFSKQPADSVTAVKHLPASPTKISAAPSRASTTSISPAAKGR